MLLVVATSAGAMPLTFSGWRPGHPAAPMAQLPSPRHQMLTLRNSDTGAQPRWSQGAEASWGRKQIKLDSFHSSSQPLTADKMHPLGLLSLALHPLPQCCEGLNSQETGRSHLCLGQECTSHLLGDLCPSLCLRPHSWEMERAGLSRTTGDQRPPAQVALSQHQSPRSLWYPVPGTEQMLKRCL